MKHIKIHMLAIAMVAVASLIGGGCSLIPDKTVTTASQVEVSTVKDSLGLTISSATGTVEAVRRLLAVDVLTPDQADVYLAKMREVQKLLEAGKTLAAEDLLTSDEALLVLYQLTAPKE